MTSLRERLKNGQHVLGSWISSSSPVVCELMAAAGFDFLALDVEHSPVDLVQAQALFQAIRSGNPDCSPLVRLSGVDYPQAKRFLDAGASGLIGPLVNNADQARTLVDAAKYPPLGRRGVGFCRANGYGKHLQQEVATVNDRILVAVQIEHIEGVENIDSILAVPGVDAVFIGPYDLTASMGITGRFDHSDFLCAKQRILSACRRAGVAAGIHIIQPDPGELILRANEGYSLLAYSLDITMLLQASSHGVESFRAHSPKPN